MQQSKVNKNIKKLAHNCQEGTQLRKRGTQLSRKVRNYMKGVHSNQNEHNTTQKSK